MSSGFDCKRFQVVDDVLSAMVVGLLTIRLPIRNEPLRRGGANTGRVSVFSGAGCGDELAMYSIDMDENYNPSAANLGVFVVMSIVPIAVYVVAVLVLPWVGRGLQ